MADRRAFKPQITMMSIVLIFISSIFSGHVVVSRSVDLNFLKNKHPLKNLPVFKRFIRAAEALEQHQDTTEVPLDSLKLKQLNLPDTDSDVVVAYNLSSQPRGSFHRFRREVCEVPLELQEKVSDLAKTLNDSLYYGFLPHTDFIEDKSPKYTNCPSAVRSWWPQRQDNLRAHCPWTMILKDMGEQTYPKYVPAASCNCAFCVMPTSFGCEELKYVFTYFKVISCVEEIAFVSKKTMTVTTGCFCMAATRSKPNPLRIPMVTPPNYF